ncbi:hypothetical protein BGZ49_007300 [Haplosporangium sp. Z 27]|nr:hypothetical protein BGZ49_007300 [Haplosporangium sp. Z 27]
MNLIEAAQRNNINAVRRLIDSSDINERGDDGYTALHHATENGNRDMVSLLLANGANPNIVEDRGYTTLHFAAMKNDSNSPKLPVEHGGDLNAQTNEGDAMIHCAVIGVTETNNGWGMIKYMLNHGAGHNPVNIDDITVKDMFLQRDHNALQEYNDIVTQILGDNPPE